MRRLWPHLTVRPVPTHIAFFVSQAGAALGPGLVTGDSMLISSFGAGALALAIIFVSTSTLSKAVEAAHVCG